MNSHNIALVKGKRYIVVTNRTTIRGSYLGKDVYGRFQFDLRPTHGTTTVDPQDIDHIEEV